LLLVLQQAFDFPSLLAYWARERPDWFLPVAGAGKSASA
jgi:hypothetical protein